jgi:two-component SAPR family response regulator
MKTRLEPWQQSLLKKITPNLHAMVYQTDQALNTLSNHEDRIALTMTYYPQNINLIYKNANQMSDTIEAVTQYAHAEEKMAELNKMNGTKAGS